MYLFNPALSWISHKQHTERLFPESCKIAVLCLLITTVSQDLKSTFQTHSMKWDLQHCICVDPPQWISFIVSMYIKTSSQHSTTLPHSTHSRKPFECTSIHVRATLLWIKPVQLTVVLEWCNHLDRANCWVFPMKLALLVGCQFHWFQHLCLLVYVIQRQLLTMCDWLMGKHLLCS